MSVFDIYACYIKDAVIKKRKDNIMKNDLEVVNSNKILSEYIKNANIEDRMLILCTQKTNEQLIKSIILSNAKIDNNSDMNNLSNQEWTDIANNINDLVNRNISIANLNNKDIKTIILKLKENNIKFKKVLVDSIENLKTLEDYAELESFLCTSGYNIITFQT